jgi:MFS family permease
LNRLRDLWINRNFARLWAAQALSGLGDFIFETTLIVWIASDLAEGRSWAPLAVTLLLVASTIPILFVGPIAGALVDRWVDKRRVLLRANLISAALILILLPAAGIVPVPFVDESELPLAWRLGSIFFIVFVASGVAQFLRPSAAVMLRDVVPDAERPRAAGLNQAASSMALLLGPSLAAPLLFGFGAGWALAINAGSFVVSFLFVRSIRMPEIASPVNIETQPSAREVLRDIREGIRFFRQSHVLMRLAVALTIAIFGLGALNALDIFFVTDNLSTPAKSYGILSSGEGAGTILGAIVWGLIATRLGLARTLWIGVLGVGVAIIVYARMTSFPPAVGTMFAVGLFASAANVTIGPIMFRVTPRAFVGRVSATLNPLVNAALLLGLVVGGTLYSTVLRNLDRTVFGIHFGPLDTIFLGVGILCVLGGLYARGLHVPVDIEEECDPSYPEEGRAQADPSVS